MSLKACQNTQRIVEISRIVRFAVSLLPATGEAVERVPLIEVGLSVTPEECGRRAKSSFG